MPESWSPDGRTLRFRVATGANYTLAALSLPDMKGRASGDRISSSERNNDIMRDGKRFLGVVAAGESPASGAAAAPQMQVVLNWFEELKARVPMK